MESIVARIVKNGNWTIEGGLKFDGIYINPRKRNMSQRLAASLRKVIPDYANDYLKQQLSNDSNFVTERGIKYFKWNGKRYLYSRGGNEVQSKTLNKLYDRIKKNKIMEDTKAIAQNPKEFYDQLRESYNEFLNKEDQEYKKYVKDIKRELALLDDSVRLEPVTVELLKMNIVDLIRIIKSTMKKRIPILEFEDKHFYLNDRTIDKLQKIFKKLNNEEIRVTNTTGSEEQLLTLMMESEVKVHAIDPKKKKNGGVKQKPKGGFFPFNNLTNFNLEKFGIFKKGEEDYDYNCLYIALKTLGLSQEKLDKLLVLTACRDIPQEKLKDIAEELDIHISLYKSETATDKKRTLPYGDKTKEKFRIGLIHDHYYALTDSGITSKAFQVYEEFKDDPRLCDIFRVRNGKADYDESRHVESSEMIKALLASPYIKPIEFEDVMSTQFYSKVEKVRKINTDPKSFRKRDEIEDIYDITKKGETCENKYMLFFFDFEATTQGKHIPYLCCVWVSDNLKATFKGIDCGKQLLKWVGNVYSKYGNSKKCMMIAHNLGYDIRHLVRDMYTKSILPKGTKTLSATANYYHFGKKIEIHFKDSLAMIPVGLGEFAGIFNLEDEKEVFPYNYYTQETIKDKWGDIAEACKHLKESDQEQFCDNIYKLGIYKNGKFDMLAYAEYYCQKDCKVLGIGYNTMREWIQEISSCDINNLCTISTVARSIITKTGCFENCVEICGIMREWFMGAVYGGRVMLHDNAKIIATGDIEDVDGVSLYSSAMHRMGGFLQGTPKPLTDKHLAMKDLREFLAKQDGFFIKIKVKHVGKFLKMPLLSVKDENDTRQYTNHVVGQEFILDKFFVEDIEKYQLIEYDIIEGVYFNEKRNNKIKDVIEYLFNTRLSYKEAGNKIEQAFKLILNSCYGYTIMKAHEYDYEIMTKKRFEDYEKLNHNFIYSAEDIGDNQKVVKKFKSINDHFSSPHIGAEILSMSKRIMNELFCLMEDHNMIVLMQDTDSCHTFKKYVPELQKLYYEEYDRELLGDNLGQFNCDFSLKYSVGDKKVKCDNVYSQLFIGVGKKFYYDRIRGNKKEKDGGGIVEGEHYKAKGIPQKTVVYTSNHTQQSIENIYLDLYNDEDIDFDLTHAGSNATFDFTSTYEIFTKSEFVRKVQLDNPYKLKIHDGVITYNSMAV